MFSKQRKNYVLAERP